jgi:cytochrome c biogenesis protein CcmG, thiol:disulfide interchange protein DsbE
VTARRVRLAAQIASVLLVAGLLALLAWRLSTQGGDDIDAALERGETPVAPAFELERLDGGGTLSLESLRGQAAVINFWASWCDPCAREADALDAAWREYRSRGLVVVGIDTRDFADDARRFARKYGMTYPLVRDVPAKIWTKYEGTGFPETLVVDREGRLVCRRFIGPVDGDAKTHAEFERCIVRALAS